MEAKDLRIGNLLNFPFISNDVQIIGINAYEANNGDILYKFSAKEGINLYCEPLTVFKPIPLTDGWLLRSGATVDGHKSLFSRFKLLWKSSYKYWYVVDKETNCYLTKIEFVHEWQNFVFVMDGTELTINPKG